ncbi:thiamine pyrophosphokinase [Hymenopellis radicata]|nr:thiamine pyrophosphokinase [Hymenopellis radicata]
MYSWDIDFLNQVPSSRGVKRALIILNQPFSWTLLNRLWNNCEFRLCADGGANRLHDTARIKEQFLPHAVIGDLDSIRKDVRDFYSRQGVVVHQDHDQDSTDLMKCMQSVTEQQGDELWEVILLGGLAGRLDQTIHSLSYLHKLRKDKTKRVFAVTDDNLGWVLDSGEHSIKVDHSSWGKTCGLLPVGVDQTILSTKGLEWNLTEQESSFDTLVSTSNHLVRDESIVWIETSKPIWWTVELHVEVHVLYFAGALTATGVSEELVPIPISGFLLDKLGDLLISRHPNSGLDKVLENSQWSVNEEMIDNPATFELTEGAEIAVICPVSGG